MQPTFPMPPMPPMPKTRLGGVLLLCLALWACSSGLGEAPLAQADREFANGNYLKAETLYESYLQANPQGDGRWDAWRQLVRISVTVTGNDKKAARLLEAMQLEYSEDSERFVDLSWQLAETYTRLHDWDKASETWQTLLDQGDLAPAQAAEVHWNLGKIHQYQGRYGMAKDAMLACLEQEGDQTPHARCMYELAQAYSLLKNRAQARVWLDRLLALPGLDPELHALGTYMLCEILEAEGQKAQARALLESIRQTYPNPLVIETRLRQLAE